MAEGGFTVESQIAGDIKRYWLSLNADLRERVRQFEEETGLTVKVVEVHGHGSTKHVATGLAYGARVLTPSVNVTAEIRDV